MGGVSTPAAPAGSPHAICQFRVRRRDGDPFRQTVLGLWSNHAAAAHHTCGPPWPSVVKVADMDLSYSEEYERFRTEVRQFLDEQWTDEDRNSTPPPDGQAALMGAVVRTDDRATEFRLK